MSDYDPEDPEEIKQFRKNTLDVHIAHAQAHADEWDKYVAWYLGDVPDQYNRPAGYASPSAISPTADDFRIDANYVYAYLDTMIAVVCHQNPQLTINPYNQEVEQAAKARESLANDTFRRDKLAKKERRMALFCGLYGRSYSKTVWSTKHRRPVTTVHSPRTVYTDPTLPWEDTRYVIEAVPYTEREFKRKVKEAGWKLQDDKWPSFDQIPEWFVDPRDGNGLYSQSVYEANRWIVVYEYHDLESGKLAILLQNQVEPLWEGDLPYKYVKNVYGCVVYNENPRDESGVSDAKLIAKHQEQLNELDAYELWHTFTTIPIPMMDGASFDDPEMSITAYQNATGPGDIARMDMKGDKPLRDAVFFSQTPSSIPAFHAMRERISSQIEFILGLSQYARGQVGKSELATEMSLADNANRNRNGARIAVMNAWVVDVGQKTIGLWREFFPRSAEVFLPGQEMFSQVLVDRMTAAFGDPGEDLTDEQMFGEEWYYSYDVVASSPSENDKTALVARVVQLAPLLMQAGNIDKGILAAWVAEMIGAKRIVSNKPQAPLGQPGGTPGSPGFSGQPGLPQGGEITPPGMDAEHEQNLPQGSRQLASQPKVDTKGLF